MFPSSLQRKVSGFSPGIVILNTLPLSGFNDRRGFPSHLRQFYRRVEGHLGLGGWVEGDRRGPNPDFLSGDELGPVWFFSLINGICRLPGDPYELHYSLYFMRGLQMCPKSSSHPCQRPFGTPLGCGQWPPQFLPSFTGVILCVASCCGARHEALNEGFLSAVGGFAWRGSNGTDAEQPTARAFEAFQVTLDYCLLIELAVRRGSGGGQLEAAWVHICFSFASSYV